ncbi:Alpha beta-propellor repeat-containing integrin [Ignavibacterium album JCM 16511]|uniref:Alpha beta-propellor repeat-containing integrin n=1 Tax=Ignavibacterium album (strain DSM 19864 / JCM 16511 / NBRC 101810 / Mat9-16) TaxID=945713 RepID=I0AMZ4_IGNAJ|nr:hypothetical protein [Ignavibacterium album]AFH50351.1 Alpha beta-propellor repeat-containing integrin [Ignavibacterium album JCM 16511]
MKFLKLITNIFIVIFLLSTNSFSQLKMDENLYNEIQQKLIFKYGDSVKLKWIYQIDSLELYDGYYPLPYKLSNPYGTLTHTTIFTATKQTEFSCKGLVGIYKNGSILWDSDTTMNCTSDLDKYTGLVIFSVSDINRDGKVDIVLSSISFGPTDYSTVHRLYAYSWDGSNGWLITDTDSEGRSTLNSFLGPGDFDFVDVDGDGIYEITADWYIDLDEYKTKLKVFTYYWNGYKYAFDSNKPQPQPYDFLVQNNIDVSLKASVEKVDSLYNYNYVLHNLSNSKQEIKYFYLQFSSDSIYSSSQPKNWLFVGSSGLFLFACLENPSLFYDSVNFVKKGEYKDFNFTAKGLPAIIQCFIQAYNQTPPLEDTVEGRFISFDDFNNNILVNSARIFTVGPSEHFYSLENIEIIDSLNGYVSQSHQLGWITNQTTADKYDSLFNAAKAQLQQNNNNAARTTLQTVLQQVDIDSTDNLTSEAYALIKYNTEYLIEKIPLQTQLTLDVINPTMSLVNPGSFTMEVKGTGFTANSVIYFNSNARTTTFVTDTLLTAEIQSTDVSAAGNFPVWVSTGTTKSDTLIYSVVTTLPKPVRPVLECVRNNGDGTYTAYFGYKNDNTVSVYIPLGSKSKFTPTPQDRGQTRVFLPGRHNRVFTVSFNGSNLVWTLNGRTSTASSNSAPCN